MSLVVCEHVGLAFGAATIFSSISVRIEKRDRLALVGAHQTDKWTLGSARCGYDPKLRRAVYIDVCRR